MMKGKKYRIGDAKGVEWKERMEKRDENRSINRKKAKVETRKNDRHIVGHI